MKYITIALLMASGLVSTAQARSQVDCLARMAYFEARGEGVVGRRAVMDVTLNRAEHKEFANTVCGNLTGDQYQWVKKNPKVRDPFLYAQFKQEADAVYAAHALGERQDSTNGAYFFSSNGVKPAKRAYRKSRVGGHTFYGLKPL